MKRLYVLCGAMGVGKSATGRALRDLLPDCAFLDGDWCWDMHPLSRHGGHKARGAGQHLLRAQQLPHLRRV